MCLFRHRKRFVQQRTELCLRSLQVRQGREIQRVNPSVHAHGAKCKQHARGAGDIIRPGKRAHGKGREIAVLPECIGEAEMIIEIAKIEDCTSIHRQHSAASFPFIK